MRNYSSLKAERQQLQSVQDEVKSRHTVTLNTAIPYTGKTRQLLQAYTVMIRKIDKQLQTLTDAIDRCSNQDTKQILTRNLIDGESLQEIADSMYMSISNTNRLKAAGMKTIAEYLPE